MPRLKVAIMGPGHVGKTEITKRFLRGRQYMETATPASPSEGRYLTLLTAADDTHIKMFDVDGSPCRVEVVDASTGRRRKRDSITKAGVETYLRINENAIREAQGFLLVFSLTQKSTLQDVEKLRARINRIKGPQGNHVPIVIVGSGCSVFGSLTADKLDLDDDREVTFEDAENVAHASDCVYVETSATADINVLTAFEEVVRQMRTHPNLGKPERERKKPQFKCLVM